MWILVIFLWTASHSCCVEIFIDMWELCFLEKFAIIIYTFWPDLSVITCVCVFLKFQNHLKSVQRETSDSGSISDEYYKNIKED